MTESLQTLVHVGEWTVFAEELTAHLVVRQIPVTVADRRSLTDYLELLDISDHQEFRFIADRQLSMQALAITDGLS